MSKRKNIINDKCIRKLKKLQSNVDNITKSILKEYSEKLRYDIEFQLSSAVSEFYSYEPNYYDRIGSLYNSYYSTLKKKSNSWIIEFGFSSENIQPHERLKTEGGIDYLYDLTVLKGYHGGADKGKEHPQKGTPYYRKYEPSYKYWNREADKDSVSIYENAENKIYSNVLTQTYAIKFRNEFNEEYRKRLNRCIK